jgi:biotin carboxylase
VSIEALASAGRVVFQNVTAKLVQEGRYPVEIGHTVPAQLPAEAVSALTDGMSRLIRATGYDHGVLHAEWILADGRPYLIECAARMPGDNIKDLIDLAYGGDLIADYVRVLEGTDPGRPPDPKRGAAIRFLSQPSGVVAEVRGVEAVAAAAGVHEVAITTEPGRRIELPTSSWQRVGHVIVTGADGVQARELADRLAGMIRIVAREDR